MNHRITAGAVFFTMALAACSAEMPAASTGAVASSSSATSTTGAGSTTSSPMLSEEQSLRFVDVTGSAGVTFTHATPFDAANYTVAMDSAKMIGGATTGDFTNDGLPDLFVIGGGLAADAFFVNLGDGTFENRAEPAGLIGDWHLGAGAAAGDYDGDGWLDLFVTSHGTPGDPQPGRHRLFHNNGDGTFTDVAERAGVATTAREEADGFGAAFGDIDLDGDLDLFVAGGGKDSEGNPLFRNDGDGTFTDITDEAGIVDDGIRGFSPCLVDTDGDRYPELLLAADFGTSRYFVNNRDGTFREHTIGAGTGLEWSGMGTTVADFNGDGLVDWMVTAIFDDEAAGRGDGNSLYLNLGRNTFEQSAAALGVDDGGWGWGPAAFDVDLDGLIDVVENNGWNFEAYTSESAKVWLQQPDGTFVDGAADSGLDEYRLFGLSTIDFDYDGDGDRDIAFTAPNDEFRLYRTDAPPGRGWLGVTLDTADAPGLAPGGIGAVVRATVGGTTMSRFVTGCSTYLGQGDPNPHFGLGAAHTVDELIVEWPDGTVTRLTDVAADRMLVVAP